jgi:hypothetical protein
MAKSSLFGYRNLVVSSKRRDDSAVFPVAYFDAILQHDVLVAGLVRLLLPHPFQLLGKHTVNKL